MLLQANFCIVRNQKSNRYQLQILKNTKNDTLKYDKKDENLLTPEIFESYNKIYPEREVINNKEGIYEKEKNLNFGSGFGNGHIHVWNDRLRRQEQRNRQRVQVMDLR